MVLLGDVGQVESHFGLLGASVSARWVKWNLILVCWEPVSVQDRCTVGAEHTIGSKLFWTHPMELLGDVGHVESYFGPLGASFGAR